MSDTSLVFDPTVQQLGANGGVSLDRFTMGGQTLVALRSASRSG